MARATTRPIIERGIVIDPDGFPVAFVQWEKGTTIPSFHIRDRAGNIIERRRLLDGVLYEPGAENKRWTGSGWEEPDVEEIWVDQNGRFRRRVRVFSQFMNRAKPIPDGWAIAASPPPASKSRRPIYDAEAQEWKFATPKILLDENGIVLNRVLVDPRGGAAPPDLPPGQSLIPDAAPGVSVRKGYRHTGNGQFEPPRQG